jgi:hypothetical protein
MFKKHSNSLTFAAAIAASLWVSVTAASSGSLSPVDNQSRYLPIQSIRYEFGSVSISGYFTQEAATCIVMLTILDYNVAEGEMRVSPVRLRMTLRPGQIAGLDTEDGRALNVTCNEGAASLLVDVGERDRLADIQAATLTNAVAGSH